VKELRPQDHVAIVVYAGAAGLVLPSTPGDQKSRILDAIDALEAGGSTAGGAGIRLAYDVAKENRIEGGINRVILATDGDFNVGVSSDAEMVRLIEEKREQGTSLTVLGFGTGNLKDSKMEKLADHGNGHYAYVDSFNEARKVFVREIGGTLATIAKDVKVQVEFNPTRVASYRLIGYENRMLRDEDFNDDKKDAGDLGAGHSVTALYEVIPVGAPDADSVRKGDPLRYQSTEVSRKATGKDELLYVKLRYKEPEGGASKLLAHVVRDRVAEPSDDFRFAAAVAEFGMLLRDSPYKGKATFEQALSLAESGRGEDVNGDRGEFISLVKSMQRIAAAETVSENR
jgi:Ca-activated chloride channel family protein